MRSWILVISEGHVWPYEHIVLYRDPCRDKDKWADLAVVPNSHTLFDVDIGIDLSVLSNPTAVEID